ncbi:hypothetical protein BV22DRAFT_1042671 [Leucogyrophana mollusca]|uniref:Uncharacterized protein n=1 Tax=Leucogyrophana mollusca TaxID=85980 RepID=A0ACB8C018_9AGAM|nr:hypothetical protein BV22DRAFT_1042671 [Leucogyrophana mollusca]
MLFKVAAIVLSGICVTLAKTGPWYMLHIYSEPNYKGSHERHHGGLPLGGDSNSASCAHCMDHQNPKINNHLHSFKFTVNGPDKDEKIVLKLFNQADCYDEYSNVYFSGSVPKVLGNVTETSSHKVCWY